MGVSFNANYGNYYLPTYIKDVENVAKYVYGTQVVPQKESIMAGTGGMLAFSGVIEGFNTLGWLKKNHGNLKEAFVNGTNTVKENTRTLMGKLSQGGWRQPNIYKEAWTNYSAKMVKESLPDFTKKVYSTEAKNLYTKAAKLADDAIKATGSENASSLMKQANQTLAKAKVASAGAKNIYAGKGFFGNIGNGFKWIGSGFSKVTGISKLNKMVNKFAVESPITAGVLKCGKGAGLDLIITGGIELMTQVVPTYKQLGFIKGTKQLFKSSLTTLASAGGWAAGATIGGAIGSVLPVAGTLAGGIIGGVLTMFGGAIASGILTKCTKSLVGENELDKFKAKEAQQLAKSNDTQAVQETMITAAQRLKAEGIESEENKVVANSLNNLASKLPIQTTEQQTESNNTMVSNPFTNENMIKQLQQEAQYKY